MRYDSVIIGGGIAGLQAAIQLGRYEHQVLVIDKEYGRSTLCRSYHNILGWPEGVSGEHLRQLGREHADALGVQFLKDEVIAVSKQQDGFGLTTAGGGRYEANTLLIATGIMDRFPPLPGLVPCLGRSVYVCPDCDGYEVKNKQTIIIGSGHSGAAMSRTLTYWTDQLVYINHEQKEISREELERLNEHQIQLVNDLAVEVLHLDGQFYGVKLADGKVIEGERGFIAFGGNAVHSELAAQLGVELMDNKHIITDPRSKMTNVQNVWAAGDIGVHSEQVTIAMGEGSQSAIWMHKAIMHLKNKKAEMVTI